MARRSDEREAARAEYMARKKKGGEVNLRQLADDLHLKYDTVRRWKSKDRWDTPTGRKPGGQPGNQNAAGNSGGGAPAGNLNAEKDGAYSRIFFDKLTPAEQGAFDDAPRNGVEALQHLDRWRVGGHAGGLRRNTASQQGRHWTIPRERFCPRRCAGGKKQMGDVVKNGVCTMVGVIGSLIASQFGGWDAALSTLILFMAVDYITGLVVAGVFHASPKSKDGALESRAGWKGLCRKGVTLLIVLVACHLDTVMGSNFIRDATVIAFIANETLSIIENAGLMGVPIPKALTGAIEILKQKSEQDNMEE